MKFRNGFVSNSSSTAFIIKNKSNKPKTILDFCKENLNLVHLFNEQYDYDYTEDQLLESAKSRLNRYKDCLFNPNSENHCVFGDEQRDVIGHIFDYILRDGGESKSFTWEFKEHLR